MSDERKELTLAEARDGDRVVVVALRDDEVKWQALRFGIGEGSTIRVEKNIHRGPVIVSKKRLEIAIGRNIAEGVSVKPADNLHGEAQKNDR